MVRNVFENGKLPKSIKTTWIAMIPKFEGASDLKDYMSISILGCIYKVISKVCL